MKKLLLIFAILCINKSFLQACEPEEKQKVELEIPFEVKKAINLWKPVIDRDTSSESEYYTKVLNDFIKNKKNLEAKDKDENTLLNLAAAKFRGQYLVQNLLSMGAEIETKDKRGLTPLWKAVYDRNPETVEILLKYGAIIDQKSLEHADIMYSAYKTRPSDAHKAEGFKKILDLFEKYKGKKSGIIQSETGIPKDVVESIILGY